MVHLPVGIQFHFYRTAQLPGRVRAGREPTGSAVTEKSRLRRYSASSVGGREAVRFAPRDVPVFAALFRVLLTVLVAARFAVPLTAWAEREAAPRLRGVVPFLAVIGSPFPGLPLAESIASE